MAFSSELAAGSREETASINDKRQAPIQDNRPLPKII
jgi:hypothetical protein